MFSSIPRRPWVFLGQGSWDGFGTVKVDAADMLDPWDDEQLWEYSGDIELNVIMIKIIYNYSILLWLLLLLLSYDFRWFTRVSSILKGFGAPGAVQNTWNFDNWKVREELTIIPFDTLAKKGGVHVDAWCTLCTIGQDFKQTVLQSLLILEPRVDLSPMTISWGSSVFHVLFTYFMNSSSLR